MRNHDEKTKDMVESILPSKRRKGARFERARVHRRERALVRASLLRISRLIDLDDFDGDLGYEDRKAICRLVESRREADKVAPLERWAERLIDKDPILRAMDYDERLAYFAVLLPDNTVGRHALSHIRWVIGTPPEWQFHRRPSPEDGRCPGPRLTCRRGHPRRGVAKASSTAAPSRRWRKIIRPKPTKPRWSHPTGDR